MPPNIPSLLRDTGDGLKRCLRWFAILIFVATTAGCSQDTSGPSSSDRSEFSGRGGKYTVSHFQSGARHQVDFSVYLPPGWSPEGTETYPLIFFLHGQHGDHYSFTNSVPLADLNRWVSQGLVPPFVLVAPNGSDIPASVQWYYPNNVQLLTSEAPNELRAFSFETFRAGGAPNRTSVHGHSRGASGALYFALNHWDSFASSVANAFVSDYVLDDLRDDATRNRDAIVASGISMRMVIGTDDSFSLDLGRVGSPVLHEHLDTLGIQHEYQVLPQVTHGLSDIWHFERSDDLMNGLHELQLHAAAWAQGG